MYMGYIDIYSIPHRYGYIVFFIMGTMMGSLGSVIITRLHYDIKLSTLWSCIGGRSQCPTCNTHLPRYSLIPILSWIIQGGKCHSCAGRISIIYPILELCSGIGYIIGYTWVATTTDTILLSDVIMSIRLGTLIWSMVLLIATDFLYMELHYIATGILYILIGVGIWQGYLASPFTALQWATAFGISFIGLYYIAMLYASYKYSIPGTPGMGFGDVIVAPALGAILATPHINSIELIHYIARFTILASGISLSIIAIQGIYKTNLSHVAFLPGLCIACLVCAGQFNII